MSLFANSLGFQSLPVGYFAALAGVVIGYLALAELAKREFYRHREHPTPPTAPAHHRRVEPQAARFSHRGALGR